MSLIVTGIVTQSVPVLGIVTLTFTDTTAGVSGLVSRVLAIYDDNGNLLTSINMGATLVATYTVSQDTYLLLIETIVDGSGTSIGEFKFLSDSFFIYNFSLGVAALPSQCSDLYGTIANLSNALINQTAAINMALFGQGVVAQALITYANFLTTTPYYA